MDVKKKKFLQGTGLGSPGETFFFFPLPYVTCPVVTVTQKTVHISTAITPVKTQGGCAAFVEILKALVHTMQWWNKTSKHNSGCHAENWREEKSFYKSSDVNVLSDIHLLNKITNVSAVYFKTIQIIQYLKLIPLVSLCHIRAFTLKTQWKTSPTRSSS